MNSPNLQSPNMADLLASLSSHDDAVRKMAAFRLQSMTNDPSFAEQFCAHGGLLRLKDVLLESSGNTLAYTLASFARVLELDQGWDAVDRKVVQKAVELVVCQPLVNILRGAMAVLVSIVSRPHNDERTTGSNEYVGGFKALKPAIGHYPQFLEMLVSRLSSADHALCANALQLINALMRDAISSDDETEWPKFIKRIQDLGVIKAVYVLMQSSALQDLAYPLLEFQQLTKVLLTRWRDVKVDITKPEHRRTIKAIHLASNPPEKESLKELNINGAKPKHDPNKWRRLGFTVENPEPDFMEMGFLGMMDLSDYVRKHQDEYQNILVEQESLVRTACCPLARASLAITSILFEHFEVDKLEDLESQAYLVLESRSNYEQLFKPLLLHWSRLHVASLHAFMRLWKDTGAEGEDFQKIVDLARILVESVIGGAERTRDIESVEQELASSDFRRLRELQMEVLDLAYEDLWACHLQGTREELANEALQFVKEQRIRCLLRGEWFPHISVTSTNYKAGGPVQATDLAEEEIEGYRFVQLSSDRKSLSWADFEEKYPGAPPRQLLTNTLPLTAVSSVVSNITANSERKDSMTAEQYVTTRITVHGHEPRARNQPRGHSRKDSKSSSRTNQREIELLTFQPHDHAVASEWLDGLLMLLDQQPITAETNKLVKTIGEMGLKVRLLNVRGSDDDGIIDGIEGIEAPPVPSRDGLDDDYFYDI